LIFHYCHPQHVIASPYAGQGLLGAWKPFIHDPQ
jgi:hypothetical protein